MSRYLWIASYPKSGNTWFRALLANADPDRTEPADLNGLGSGLVVVRARFDVAAGVESSDLTEEEADALKCRVSAWDAERTEGDGPLFRKLHDAFHSPFDGAPSVPVEASRGAIYLVRDPRDVVLSYANHRGRSPAHTVGAMAKETHRLAGPSSSQFPQHLGSWSRHVEGWLDQSLIPVHLVRYEDLHADPVGVFAAALAFAGVDTPRWVVERAAEWSRFHRLQRAEQEDGFFEKPDSARSFFHSGTAGRWREELDPELVQAIEDRHGPVMERLGYALTREPVG